MALTATIFKANLDISDLRRHYYAQHALTLARHPSETDERMMLRLLAFALFASERMTFSRGLSNDDEPDLWQKSLSGEIELWIELGLPSLKRIKKARSQCRNLILISYGGRAAKLWWEEHRSALTTMKNTLVLDIDQASSQALADWTARSMDLQITLDDSTVWLTAEAGSLEITPLLLSDTLSESLF